ncbi:MULTISPECIES: nitrogen regulation protein NR(II) [unclassified Halorubrum]|uniref:two-component system sensor histidine kinase NtrB n=1 Tax=unclassified Halorubrum TaxID=2642239 RepID=UPI000B98232A|nr:MULTISPECIES: PAS domain-containing sensor histidine kinase [unclassified Halorubrum]OYR42457.1 PAS domain-containing sensor histidine kinase [Halorubrum sp. Hd13]OYR44328.1 PAS domain-containing sensor histidine kinase [Halorubrum sp. Ea8]OYR49367.1 PAS domain-containing sensor histidine kinase [Halorubrum sp. Eb13]OYR56376.1 PAS domain-containing sensor histidine kinase [Halorubrum sp. Ea1]
MTERSPRGEEIRRYETVLDSLDDAVYAVRPDGTIAYVNERYAEMKGVSRDELVGTEIYDWVTEETAEEARRVRREMAAGDRETGVVEYDFLTADGERFPVEMRFSLVTGEDGDGLNRVGVIRDVRERKRREETLREKNERLEEFASIVSHDLRNPLSVARGRLELAREERDSEHLEAVADAHERMETLIEDLLSLARDGDGAEDAERIPLREFVEACWEGVETGDATLRVETDRAVRADRSRLRQLFENLVRNAVEHAGDDVTVTVGDLDGGFHVADDGPGIPEGDREAVFETGHSTGENGTGFGLAIVESVAATQGWDVGVTESADGGARFEFTGVDVPD